MRSATADTTSAPTVRDWSQVDERFEPRGLRHGDRVVAVSTVSPSSITIHGYGVYQHGTATEAEAGALSRLAQAIRAADDIVGDYAPLVDGACRHLPKSQAEAQRTRFHSIESRRRAQPAEYRARTMLDRVHHRPRVRLDSGDVIDAGTCFVMRADTFQRYAAGSIVTKANAAA